MRRDKETKRQKDKSTIGREKARKEACTAARVLCLTKSNIKNKRRTVGTGEATWRTPHCDVALTQGDVKTNW